MISIVDYGAGNLASVVNMLKRVGSQSKVIKTPEEVLNAEKIILPGVGHFDNGMKRLNESGMVEALTHKVMIENVPFLGICLGMQMLADSSEEGEGKGLGWIPGKVRKLSFDGYAEKIRVPHMGWNLVKSLKKSPLVLDFPEEVRFYFVHSYFYDCDDHNDILMMTDYGKPFTSAIERGNIMGVQFHPEKSHKFGMQLMRNFIAI